MIQNTSQPTDTGFGSFLNSQEFYELMQEYRHTTLDAAKEFEAVIQALLMAISQPIQPASERLLEIIAAAYQIAGAYEAPDYVLDVLANPTTATQEQIDALLPFAPVQPATDLTDEYRACCLDSGAIEEGRAICAYESTGGNLWNRLSHEQRHYWRKVALHVMHANPKNQLGAD